LFDNKHDPDEICRLNPLEELSRTLTWQLDVNYSELVSIEHQHKIIEVPCDDLAYLKQPFNVLIWLIAALVQTEAQVHGLHD
jgi:hypothetical protein